MEARLREFAFSEEDFNSLRALVRKHTGISLSDAKRELVYGRLSRRLRALGLDSFRDYRNVLTASPEGQEMVEFCNAITTNLTSFFRESYHFDYLRDQILVPLGTRPPGQRLRIRGVCAEDRVKGMSHARLSAFFREQLEGGALRLAVIPGIQELTLVGRTIYRRNES